MADISSFPILSLPSFEFKITELDGKLYIWDIIRKKNIVLTPEEWVRQHIVQLLVQHYNYPKSLLRLENSLKYNRLDKRSDILVYNREGNPFLIIECKAADVNVNQQVLEQATRYNKIVKAQYVAISNGMKTFCFEINHGTGQTVQLADLPKL